MSKRQNMPPNAGKGRAKGVPNKLTKDVRAAIAMVAEEKAGDFMQWLEQTAAGIQVEDDKGKKKWLVLPNPEGAAKVYLNAIEYHIPKLARTEVTGDKGKPLEVSIVSYGGNSNT